jgi:general secretion pathway protein L
MLGGVDGAIRAWIEGLTVAALHIANRVKPAPVIVVKRGVQDDDQSWIILQIKSGSELPLGRISSNGAVLKIEPSAAERMLKGADLRFLVPDGWIIERMLNPVPAKSRPFLDAYIRQQIERVTPWRAQDCLYEARVKTAAENAERLEVTVAVLLRRLAEGILAPFLKAGVRSVRIEPEQSGLETVVTLEHLDKARRARMRSFVGFGVTTLVMGFVVAFGVAAWHEAGQEARIGELDGINAARRQQVAAITTRMATQGADSKQFPAPILPPIADSLERLSALLPDYAYLNSLTYEDGHLRISGISREDVAALIPLIERSGTFADAVFYAPTTRLEDQTGNRFFIEMRVMGTTDASQVSIVEGGKP